MHAEIAQARARELGADRIRHGADADLEAGAVFDQRRHVLGDLAVHVARGRIRQLGQGAAAALVDDAVHLGQVNARLAPRHHRERRIDLDDDALGDVADRAQIGRDGREVEAALLVDRSDLQAGEVDLVAQEAAIEIRTLAEIERDVGDPAGIVMAPLVAREVPRQVFGTRAASGPALEHGARAHGEAGADADVAQLGRARRERGVETIRLAETEAVIEPASALHERRRGLGGEALACVLALVVRHAHSAPDAAGARMYTVPNDRQMPRRLSSRTIGATGWTRRAAAFPNRM